MGGQIEGKSNDAAVDKGQCNHLSCTTIVTE